jgi:hypothetical protein
LTEAKGIPVAEDRTGANRHDMKRLAALLDGTVVEPAPTVPPHLALDRGYAYQVCRDEATARGYTAHIPPKASEAAPRRVAVGVSGWGQRRTVGSIASGGG